MAERVVLVCDVCGSPAQQSVTFRIGSRSLAQDLCATHLQELVRLSHAPRRGRRPGAPPSSSTTGATTTRGRRRSAAKPSTAAKKTTVKRQRKRITDPVALEKRRAALAKARKALASKRAAAKKAS